MDPRPPSGDAPEWKRMNAASRDLQTLFDDGTLGQFSDGQILERFVASREEPAFGELVRRYGTMVWGVCRRVLFDHHDAEDAFQATFLVLARKAATVAPPERVGDWLHGVASQVAIRVRASTARQRGRERQVQPMPEPAAPDRADWDGLQLLIDEEIRRLPENYRVPIVLCELEGKTHGEAARLLGWPIGTVSGRLSRARKLLAERLTRRGVTLSAGVLATLFPRNADAAAAPATLVKSTITAAIGFAAGDIATGGLVSTRVASLVQGTLKMMLIARLKAAWPVILALGSLVCVCGLLMGGHADEPQRAQAPAAVQPSPPRAPAPSPPLPRVYTHPITVTGRAFDPDGKPVAGATVYLISRRADYKRIAETRTDADGRYAFRDALLPIQRADTVTERDSGVFQVFGQADGLGFAWRPEKWYEPRPRLPNLPQTPDFRDPPSHYEADAPIVLDLHYTPAARFSGTIADDRGNPLPNVRLEIRGCESLHTVDNVITGWTLGALNEPDSVPPSVKVRTTDARGRFEFTDLPEDCRFSIGVRAQGFPNRWISAATTQEPQPDHDGGPVYTGDFRLTLETALDVPISMVFADTGKPAPKVLVQAVRGLVNVAKTSDDQGHATLRLPPGTYRMENWPAVGTPYLPTECKLVVTEQSPASPFVASLRRAAEIEVTVVDAATGTGIPGVDLWQRADAGRPRERLVVRSFELATRVARRDSPRTDARGKARAFVEPGKHRIGVGLEAYPPGAQVVEADGQDVECRAGETATLKFTLRSGR